MESLSKPDCKKATKFHSRMLVFAGMSGATLAFLACYGLAALMNEILK